jgi:hypothetical protein
MKEGKGNAGVGEASPGEVCPRETTHALLLKDGVFSLLKVDTASLAARSGGGSAEPVSGFRGLCVSFCLLRKGVVVYSRLMLIWRRLLPGCVLTSMTLLGTWVRGFIPRWLAISLRSRGMCAVWMASAMAVRRVTTVAGCSYPDGPKFLPRWLSPVHVVRLPVMRRWCC